MFSSHKTVLYIKKDTITIARVSTGKKPKVTKKKTFSYTDQTFSATLKGIAKAYGKNVRIVLDEDLVYVTTIVISDQVTNERAFVYSQAQEQIPDDLDKTSWDYKIAVTIPATQQHPGYKFAQFSAIESGFFTKLFKAADVAGLNVESIEASSIALSRITKKVKGTHIIVSSNGNTLLIAAEGGLVYSTELLFGVLTAEHISQLTSYIQEKFRTTPVKIYTLGDKPMPDVENIEIQQLPYDPIIGTAMKKDTNGASQNALNLELFDITKHTISVDLPTKPTPEEIDSESLLSSKQLNARQSNAGLIFAILVVVAIVAMSAGIIWLTIQPEEIEPASEAPPDTTQESTGAANLQEQETIDRAAYAIRVLNGTSSPGNATIGQTYLLDEGFVVRQTGIADNNSYQQTVIRSRKTVDSAFLEDLERVLSSQYEVELSGQTPDSDADVEVIIGMIVTGERN